jgi:hypothetical protein
MRRAALVAAVVAVAALGLTGCSPTAPIPTPSASAVIGTWHHGSDVVVFNPDKTFTFAGMPKGVIEQASVATGASPAGPAEHATGNWSIGSGGTDVGGAPGVQLDFVSPKKIGYNYGLTLVVAGGTPMQLYVTLGRPDSGIRYVFTKKPSQSR